jgi:inner membrane protease subunit 1
MAGVSMLPTLANEGEIVIEDRLTFRLYPDRLSRGDLITLKSPLEPGRIICKRVLGLPGDIVCVDPTGEKAPSTEHVIIPQGHVWITGDNASWSRDSRHYGPVSMSLIQGRLVARVRTRVSL